MVRAWRGPKEWSPGGGRFDRGLETMLAELREYPYKNSAVARAFTEVLDMFKCNHGRAMTREDFFEMLAEYREIADWAESMMRRSLGQ
jgi:hypothetical protein